jgi:hypothetical protein
MRANERFSGRGHRAHLCKSCKRLGREELAFRQGVRDIDRLVGYSGVVLRKHRATFQRFLQHENPRIREYAERVSQESLAVQAEWRAIMQEEEAGLAEWYAAFEREEADHQWESHFAPSSEHDDIAIDEWAARFSAEKADDDAIDDWVARFASEGPDPTVDECAARFASEEPDAPTIDEGVVDWAARFASEEDDAAHAEHIIRDGAGSATSMARE